MGAEVFPAGNFDTNIQGWVRFKDSKLSHTNKALNIKSIGNSGYDGGTSAINLPAGTYQITVDIKTLTGKGRILFKHTGGKAHQFTTVGIHKITETVISGTATEFRIYGDSDVSFLCEVGSVSIKKTTAVAGSVTVFDHATKKFEQVTTDGVGSSKELVVNGDFSDGTNGWNLANVTLDGNAIRYAIDSGGGELKQTTDKLKGKHLKATCVISDYVDGAISLYSGKHHAFPASNGTHTLLLDFPDYGEINIARLYAPTHLLLESVSVKEVLPLAPTYTLKVWYIWYNHQARY